MKYLAKVTAINEVIEDLRAEGVQLNVRTDANDVWLECDSEEFAYLIERLSFNISLVDSGILKM